MKLGLTGTIATGKSTVYKLLLNKSEVIGFDADEVVHQLYERTDVIDRLTVEFGSEILGKGGGVDRSSLRSLFLADAGVRPRLESIFHPLVYEEFLNKEADLTSGQVLLADIPLLFEKADPYCFDAVVVVACSPDKQLSRLISRSKLDRETALKMISKQVKLDFKISKSDFVLWNNGSMSSLCLLYTSDAADD